ncbi:MAG: hypothetical protein GX433_13955 [Deltaproteobacteria bacterium]|nr:hypothetical protein [Deltaproteobacteria bacterium]
MNPHGSAASGAEPGHVDGIRPPILLAARSAASKIHISAQLRHRSGEIEYEYLSRRKRSQVKKTVCFYAPAM